MVRRRGWLLIRPPWRRWVGSTTRSTDVHLQHQLRQRVVQLRRHRQRARHHHHRVPAHGHRGPSPDPAQEPPGRLPAGGQRVRLGAVLVGGPEDGGQRGLQPRRLGAAGGHVLQRCGDRGRHQRPGHRQHHLPRRLPGAGPHPGQQRHRGRPHHGGDRRGHPHHGGGRRRQPLHPRRRRHPPGGRRRHQQPGRLRGRRVGGEGGRRRLPAAAHRLEARGRQRHLVRPRAATRDGLGLADHLSGERRPGDRGDHAQRLHRHVAHQRHQRPAPGPHREPGPATARPSP